MITALCLLIVKIVYTQITPAVDVFGLCLSGALALFIIVLAVIEDLSIVSAIIAKTLDIIGNLREL